MMGDDDATLMADLLTDLCHLIDADQLTDSTGEAGPDGLWAWAGRNYAEERNDEDEQGELEAPHA